MGWIADTITLVRDATNESSVNAKWTDAKIIGFMEQSFALVVPEIFRNADGPNSVRWDLSVTANTSVYERPPHVGEILQAAIMDSNNRVNRRTIPRSRFNPRGPGIHFDGPTIRFVPDLLDTETLQVWYIPNGECSLAEGTLGAGAQTTTVLTMTAATTGALDTRPNAYAGYILSLVDVSNGSVRSDRIITISAFDGTTHTITVEPALPFTPEVSVDTYEMRPLWGVKVQLAVALQTALFITAFEGMKDREVAIQRRYAQVLRDLRLQSSYLNNITSGHFESDTWENPDFRGGGFL